MISPSRITDNYPETPRTYHSVRRSSCPGAGSLPGGWSFAIPLQIACESLLEPIRNFLQTTSVGWAVQTIAMRLKTSWCDFRGRIARRGCGASMISPSRITDNYPETPRTYHSVRRSSCPGAGSLPGGWSFAIPLQIACESLLEPIRNFLQTTSVGWAVQTIAMRLKTSWCDFRGRIARRGCGAIKPCGIPCRSDAFLPPAITCSFSRRQRRAERGESCFIGFTKGICLGLYPAGKFAAVQ